MKHARATYGDRELVEAATAGRARLEKRTLVIAGTPEDDTVALHRGRRLEIDFGDDGIVDFEASRHRFDGVRVEAGDGFGTLVRPGDDDLSALDSVERVDIHGPRATTWRASARTSTASAGRRATGATASTAAAAATRSS